MKIINVDDKIMSELEKMDTLQYQLDYMAKILTQEAKLARGFSNQLQENKERICAKINKHELNEIVECPNMKDVFSTIVNAIMKDLLYAEHPGSTPRMIRDLNAEFNKNLITYMNLYGKLTELVYIDDMCKNVGGYTIKKLHTDNKYTEFDVVNYYNDEKFCMLSYCNNGSELDIHLYADDISGDYHFDSDELIQFKELRNVYLGSY